MGFGFSERRNTSTFLKSRVQGFGFMVQGFGVSERRSTRAWFHTLHSAAEQNLEHRNAALLCPLALSRKLGIDKAAKARFWRWSEPFSIRKSVNSLGLFPLGSAAVCGLTATLVTDTVFS